MLNSSLWGVLQFRPILCHTMTINLLTCSNEWVFQENMTCYPIKLSPKACISWHPGLWQGRWWLWGRVITVCYSNKSSSLRGMMHCSRPTSTTLQNAPKGRRTRPAVSLHLWSPTCYHTYKADKEPHTSLLPTIPHTTWRSSTHWLLHHTSLLTIHPAEHLTGA